MSTGNISDVLRDESPKIVRAEAEAKARIVCILTRCEAQVAGQNCVYTWGQCCGTKFSFLATTFDLLSVSTAHLRAEKEGALREEMTKNKMKYTLIPKRGVPSHPLIIPAISAVQKMDKGEYVPIWYYTKAGLKNAKSFVAIDNNALTLVMNSDSTTTAIPTTSSRDAKGMVKDHNLTMEQFQVGAMQMLTAMNQANWPTDCIQMMEAFWMNIMDHLYWTSLDEWDQLTLLLYQSEQWKTVVPKHQLLRLCLQSLRYQWRGAQGCQKKKKSMCVGVYSNKKTRNALQKLQRLS